MQHPKDDVIRDDYSISSTLSARRLSLRMDKDTYAALELAYGHALKVGSYTFRDKASFVRFLLHEAYRRIVEKDDLPKKYAPIRFGRPSAAV